MTDLMFENGFFTCLGRHYSPIDLPVSVQNVNHWLSMELCFVDGLSSSQVLWGCHIPSQGVGCVTTAKETKKEMVATARV